MKRWMIAAAVLCLARTSFGQTQADTRTFELAAVAPATPALKYELLFGFGDRRAGNAALQYMTAQELLNDVFLKEIDDTDDAYAHKSANFRELAEKMARPNGIYGLLELGGRCEDCDWGAPIREVGMYTLLPYLQQENHLAKMLELRAALQAQDGKTEDALQTIRVGFELGRKVGHAPALICGLVGVNIARLMNEALTEVMNRPESPNLYWALASMPRQLVSFPDCVEAEGTSLAVSIPVLGTKKLDAVSADDWHAALNRLVEIMPAASGQSGRQPWENPQAVADEVGRDLAKARADYSQRYGLPADQVAGLDSFKVVCTFWYQQYVDAMEEQRAMATMPYAIQIPLMKAAEDRYAQELKEESANPFLVLIGSAFTRAAATFWRGDRMRAALTDVEAIRSYAAGHDGALPAQLTDIKDTPALDNPLTGKPFDYRVDGENATLWDSEADFPLSYTVRIRK
jgi:hypothetical protein